MKTLIVESPAKAKTINKYLGTDFNVLASFGHVRDLPSRNGSVRPDEDFAIDYELAEDSRKHIIAIEKSLKNSDTLYLAPDPDREGEAIAWHVVEALLERKSLPKKIAVKRVTFTEITKKAVTEAVANPREIDMDLVNAQQARRALDYLVGFTLSPVLWRKLPGAKSAGRVQSVALRLICERDAEIEKFIAREYWDVSTILNHSKLGDVPARLTFWQGDKLEKFSITNEKQAGEIEKLLDGKNVTVAKVTPKQQKRNPYAPFTTSTLQMDASRKLGFGAKKTMMVAQKLYEGITLKGETTGLITYMRTDGVTVSNEAIADARDLITKDFGDSYLPKSPRMYKTKAKNAQEAHEAIRPTSLRRSPKDMKAFLDNDQFRLYELIYKRMLASQMESAVYDQVVVEFEQKDNNAKLRANGSVLKFDGFLKLYREGKDDGDDTKDDNDRLLPPLKEGDELDIKDIKPEQHFTEPPARYSEATLVKHLEELGIGRPSTYASIISVLQDRGYARIDKKRFHAEMRGRLVNAFLEKFFGKYVQYDFTAQLENFLDEISAGKIKWKKVLNDFWGDFAKIAEQAKELPMEDVINHLDKALESLIFGKVEVTDEDRKCPTCDNGILGLKTGKFGAFLGCTNYPECKLTRQLSEAGDGASGGEDNAEYPKELGKHPETSEMIFLKKGPYGFYVQLGEEKKPKRASLPKGQNPDDMTLDKALGLLALPREVGVHPETGKMILANIGRFGPYVKHDGAFASIPAEDDLLFIGVNRAVEIIANNAKKKGNEPLRVIGKHPESGEEIKLYSGRYGPYVKHGKTNASLGKADDEDGLSLERAVELITARENAPKKPKRKKSAAKKTTKKTAKK